MDFVNRTGVTLMISWFAVLDFFANLFLAETQNWG